MNSGLMPIPLSATLISICECTRSSTIWILPCFGVNFLPSGPDTPQHYPELTFQISNPDNSVGTVFYYFPLGSSFGANGTLTTVPTLGNTGTLTIAAAVPEPSTAFPAFVGLVVSLGVRFCLKLFR